MVLHDVAQGVNVGVRGVGAELQREIMSSGGFLGGRFGLRKVLLVGAPLQGLTVALLLVAQSANAIFVGLVLFGAFAGLVDLTMNAEGARVERDLGRPILAGLHGGASSGIGDRRHRRQPHRRQCRILAVGA